jgi:hypothetical protein
MKQRDITAVGALLLLLGTLCGATPAQAETKTVSIPASRDATIFADADEENDDVLRSANGRGSALYSGVGGAGDIKRALIKFDVWRHVPADVSITNVKLILTLSRVAEGDTRARTIDLRAVLESWGEGVSRSENEHGSPAEDGDVTWHYRRYQDEDENWKSDGGNYDYENRDDPAASTTIDHPQVGERVVWSSEEMRFDVEDWLDNPGRNYGWGLLNDPEHVRRESENEASAPAAERNYAYLGFWSRESSREQSPVLEVTYDVRP